MPKENDDLRIGKGFGFWAERVGSEAKGLVVYLVRCFECGKENYMPNVPSGQCTWCGYDSNKDPRVKKIKEATT